MPYKNASPILPFLDPQYDPNHPLNSLPQIREDPYLPLNKTERRAIQQKLVDEALDSYAPPHVPRSWETDINRAEVRKDILRLRLPNRPSDLEYRRGASGGNGVDHTRSISQPPYNSDFDDRTDFRRFAERILHLGYWRIHASTEESSGELVDPSNISPDEVCWILEYTLPECNTIRRRIANAMGLFPATIDKQNQFYDENISYAYGYGRRLFVRCQRWNKRCIRPSHLIISTFSNILLP